MRKDKLNPELKVGDEIIVVDVGGTKESISDATPDKYIRYFVTKVHEDDEQRGLHYGLNRPDVDVTDPDNPGVFELKFPNQNVKGVVR